MKEGVTFPLGLFEPAGSGARAISPLLWGLVWLSILVVVFIGVAVLAGIVVRGRGKREPNLVIPPRSGRGLWWIYGGVGISTIILIAFTGWTVTTMAGLTKPSAVPSLTVGVSARQWWWGFHYEAADPTKAFDTANELHIPVGEPVRFNLSSPDVIHSFWVPALGGKMDVIPGRTNQMWLEADKAGVYRGQCSEYCGREHAEMAFSIIAEPKVQFEAWRAAQQASAPIPATAELQDGLAHFVDRCGKCHSVRGTKANGAKGPDLTHLKSRATIAAGVLDNNLGNLSGWIAHPQGLKPGALMPDIAMSGPEFQSVLSYVETLK
ncbi:cytochrome c oxidase subunit II [Mesorhizobium sp. ES1-3]|uniref:cytochrome c oxidase subunit II n=1 Tax=Mesorhizobium sp. ES1-3 TaxID=2876628 RepID=UPI001CCC409D|nr:cytochrome c oxidase subunit II [Mesorhizobium sp. ES1-3]MBZ9673670.1 cytochrome c oxidase subunit II [Mesorhizobium sp. ES1-3]